MRTGRSLSDIALELERQTATRKDYIAPQGVIDAEVVDNAIVLAGINGAPLGLTSYAHSQLADNLGIPKRYYDRMQAEQPDLLAKNITTWLKADPDNKRMIRTLDGRVRAVLSPKFRPLDNFQLAEAVLPTLQEHGVQVMSAELTETRFYIKGILPSLSEPLPEGMSYGGHENLRPFGKDGRLVAAITISNSEVGAGSLRVEPSVFTTWCTNLAIIAEAAMKKYHVGRSFSPDENREIFRDETRDADDKAFWLKVADITNAAFNMDTFRMAVAQIRNAAGRPIVSEDLPKVVERTVKLLSLPERAATGILKHLALGGDLSQWGLSSAITSTANTAETYEEATDLERAGGKLLAVDEGSWKALAIAA